ncbi:MAG TPA: hypothetical protein DIT32_02165 [Peptococcaceae bacterium]|nr:hypothetical protein [Peptococcaceae bacterium]
MRKKCIFLIVPAMYSGGQERVVSRWTTILKDIYEIKVVLFDETVMDYPLDCDYYCLDLPSKKKATLFKKMTTVLKRVSKVRKLFRKDKPYAAVSFGHGANWVNGIACLGTCKSIVSIRGYDSLNRLKTLKGLADRFLISSAGKIICVSKVMADELAGLMPSRKDKIQVLYNAYDLNEIEDLAKQQTEMDPWFAENDVIITVGTLDPIKGYWHLIKAFSLLKLSFSNLKLLHIGPDYSGYGETLKKLVGESGHNGDIQFLGYQENPYRYIAKSKVFVLSSITEGFPNAMVEAMACRVPVVAADCKTGPREILSNDYRIKTAEDVELTDYGILVPAMNKDENYDPRVIEECDQKLASGIALLLDDKKMAEDYAQKSTQRAAVFSYSSCREEIIKIIES